MSADLKNVITTAYEKRNEINPAQVDKTLSAAILDTIAQLDAGQLRVAEKINNTWIVHEWIKQAVLLFFRIENNKLMDGGYAYFFDKVPLKFAPDNAGAIQQQGIRVVPPACIRKGTYIAPNSIIMPSFINIGAFVDSGTLIDAWATVGSCAQIGKDVHISGGVGIGGVLEPVQANPTIIEDNCFIGARSEIVEGVIVEEGSVLSMGVYLGQSTPIYDRKTGEIYYGRVPAGSVVVPGNLPSKDGKYSLYCAVIVKKVDAKTKSKINLNDLLRETELRE